MNYHNRINWNISTSPDNSLPQDNSIEALDEAHAIVAESLRMYAIKHGMNEDWTNDMLELLQNSFIEMKASVYLENRCNSYFQHANYRILDYSRNKLSNKNLSVFSPVSVFPNSSHITTEELIFVNDKNRILSHE